MRSLRWFSALLALGVAGTVATVPVRAASGAQVRVIHASPDAPAVDVYVDGAKAFSNAPFTAITKYAGLPAGMHRIQIYPAGAQPTGKGVIDATLNLGASKTYSIAAIGELK